MPTCRGFSGIRWTQIGINSGPERSQRWLLFWPYRVRYCGRGWRYLQGIYDACWREGKGVAGPCFVLVPADPFLGLFLPDRYGIP